MLKSRLFLLAPVLSLILFWPNCGQLDNLTNDAVANERPPLTGDELAKYWGLDCQLIASETQRWSEKDWTQKERFDTPLERSSIDWRGLELCAVIYNVRDTGRYQSCPDYEQALLVLKSIFSAGSASLKTIEPKLESIKNYLLGCEQRQ